MAVVTGEVDLAIGVAAPERADDDLQRRQVGADEIVLVRAGVQPENIVPDPFLGRKDYVSEDLKIVEIPGTHNSIIKEPHLSFLVEAIEAELPGHQGSDLPGTHMRSDKDRWSFALHLFKGFWLE